ncbi:DNA-3-methyladenine glycosylase I [Apilactobacillus xinyiensis]|uniref:DNA-3-methyladenine glycosylase I n=1 Tax=Apilactobacillus xinyiensis TaxID=2841032 RepID=A0ABT0I2N1_9LACO|nr:DNA-3-methyladenine glycosylase I [Apilactobacillus xinyiensis]MCK8624985.1 DNA-3-methyladenine glycosylase I [Apilactobacillus xinyiensis]
MQRCAWVDLNDEQMILYHDSEWGKPVKDDDKLFEIMSLELMQSGLSWKTILHKRQAFRAAFSNFQINRVKLMGKDINNLLGNKQIVRNRLKIKAVINNAKVIYNMQANNLSFYDYLNRIFNKHMIIDDIDTTSIKISKIMKKDGFKFIGPVMIRSFMQSIGVINEHDENCDFK